MNAAGCKLFQSKIYFWNRGRQICSGFLNNFNIIFLYRGLHECVTCQQCNMPREGNALYKQKTIFLTQKKTLSSKHATVFFILQAQECKTILDNM